jgi:hypothetical protein
MNGHVPEILWYLLAVGFVLFAIIGPIWFGLWSMHRYSIRMFAILRAYAERGEEPPAAVLEALKPPERKSGPVALEPKTRRVAQLEHFVLGLTFAAAAGAVAWWRDDAGGPQWLVYAAVIAAVVMGAGAIGRLIAALSTSRNDG